MADVENTQETVEEPKPNPYNAKKSWHTEDVMPKEGLTAESLFVAPRPGKDEGDPRPWCPSTIPLRTLWGDQLMRV